MKKSAYRQKVLIAALLAGVAVALGAVAYASIPGPSAIINGCVSNWSFNGTHALVVVDSNGTCPANTTALNWNQIGPQGPAGPQGATGAQGPAGPAGAQGQQGPAGVIGSLEQLNGISCARNNTVGTVQESLDSSAFARLRCIIPVSMSVAGSATCGVQLCTGATVSVVNFAGAVTLVAANNDAIGYSQPVTTDTSGSGSVGFVTGNGICGVYGVAPGHTFLYPIKAVDSTNYGMANASVTINC